MGKFLLAIALFGALVYAFFWMLERRKRKAAPIRPATPPKRVSAPDDDEDFLRELERRRRRAARESKDDKPPTGPANGSAQGAGPTSKPEPPAGERPNPPAGQDRPSSADDGEKKREEGPADKGQAKPE